MTPREAYWLWYDFSHIAGSAVSHKQYYVDSNDESIDWERQHHAMQVAGLAFACSLLESIGKKYADEHSSVLFKIRNAVIHNDSDLSANSDHPNSLNMCSEYLENCTRNQLNGSSRSDVRQPFQISDSGVVSFPSRDLFFFIERVLDTYMTALERSQPPPTSNLEERN